MTGTKHGVIQLRDKGPQTPEQISRYVELKEKYQDREGIKDALLDQAVALSQLREAAVSWITKEIESGKAMEEIKLLDRLLAFINSERLALVALEKMIAPSQRGRHGAKQVLDVYRKDY